MSDILCIKMEMKKTCKHMTSPENMTAAYSSHQITNY